MYEEKKGVVYLIYVPLYHLTVRGYVARGATDVKGCMYLCTHGQGHNSLARCGMQTLHRLQLSVALEMTIRNRPKLSPLVHQLMSTW
jgi:hypothetical protein